jgi:hypothetical protein
VRPVDVDRAKRLAFANDPLNLLAVDEPSNASKSHGDAATWLPSSKSYRCPLVARQIAFKIGYELAVTQAEHDAISRVLASCPTSSCPPGRRHRRRRPPSQRRSPHLPQRRGRTV